MFPVQALLTDKLTDVTVTSNASSAAVRFCYYSGPDVFPLPGTKLKTTISMSLLDTISENVCNAPASSNHHITHYVYITPNTFLNV